MSQADLTAAINVTHGTAAPRKGDLYHFAKVPPPGEHRAAKLPSPDAINGCKLKKLRGGM